MEITLYNRQRKIPIPLPWLCQFAETALNECLPHRESPCAPLPALDEVEVTFVSDATIAKVHRDFMDIPGATDVITFDHGEIVISTETARANAPQYGRTLDEELALYVIHGLLHLNGFEDKEPAKAARMHRLQEKILASCLRKLAKKGGVS
ncbi:MAG: rRNA maturation RNase YbeY [Verrucomicrobiota bacterium]